MTSGVANTADALLDLVRSATIGRYDIYAELGRGGMAAVFFALDLALERKVAIKVMLPEIMQGHNAIDRFRREARLAAALSHPHIVPIYGVGDSRDLAYFVMKYIDGRSLDSVLRSEGPQSAAFVQAILQQIGSALHHAHQRNIIHRDVKPANIMLDEGGWAMLTDFGIAKLEEDSALTSTGMIIGTPSYMSPEHFEGTGIGAAADQYALGVVGYELLTGSPPFVCNTVAELMRKHVMDAPVALHDVAPGCPRPLSDCIMRMLAKDPAYRFPTLAAAISSLAKVSPELQHAVSSQITALARVHFERRPQISVPISPAPMAPPKRAQTAGSVLDALASTVSRPDRTRRRMWYVALSVLSFAIVAAWIAWPRSPSASNPILEGAPLALVDTMRPAPTNTDFASADDASAQSGLATSPQVSSAPERAGAMGSPRSDGPWSRTPTVPPRAQAATTGKPKESTDPAEPVPTDVPRTASTTEDSRNMAEPESVATLQRDPPRGWVRLGSRDPDATLSLNDGPLRRMGEQLRVYQTTAGTVTIRVVKDGCAPPYVTSVHVPPNDTINIGRIALNCSSPSNPPQHT